MLEHWRRRFEDVKFLYMAMKEFGDMKEAGRGNFLRKIELSHDSNHTEITPRMLAEYDKWVHDEIYPPPAPHKVTELAGDGHEKVLTRVCSGHKVPMKSPKGSGGKRI